MTVLFLFLFPWSLFALLFFAFALLLACVGNVAALRQAFSGDKVGGQEAPGVGGYLELSPHVNL